MSRRKYLMLIAVALTLLTVACTVGQEPVIVPDSQSDVRWGTDPGVAQATVGELVAGNNRFAFDLYVLDTKLGQLNPLDFVPSPASSARTGHASPLP